MVCAARSMDEIDAVASQIGGKAIQCDVREEADIRGLMERTLAECGSRPGSVLPVDGNPRRSPRARPVAPLRRRAAASAPRRRVLARLGGGPRAHRPPLPRLDDRGPGAGGRGGAADRTDRSRGSGPARKRGADNPGPAPYRSGSTGRRRSIASAPGARRSTRWPNGSGSTECWHWSRRGTRRERWRSWCPFGLRTSRALDRYLRARAKRRTAGTATLWLGHAGPMTDSGVGDVVRRRATQAGIADVHPHRFRHTFAHQWLAQGGNETDLMRLAGWRSRTMLERYGASAADMRARQAHVRFGPGDRI